MDKDQSSTDACWNKEKANQRGVVEFFLLLVFDIGVFYNDLTGKIAVFIITSCGFEGNDFNC